MIRSPAVHEIYGILMQGLLQATLAAIAACYITASISRADDVDEPIALILRSDSQIASNVLRLRDVCELSQSNETAKALADIPLAPTPRMGTTQLWTRDDVTKVLSLRGMDPKSIHWSGAEIVQVSRSQNAAVAKASASQPVTPVTPVEPQRADHREFSPAFTTPVSISQAERVVTSAIESYLQLKSGSQGKWRIKPTIPPQHANALMQRRQIVSVAGGQEPWEGNQKFALLLRTPDGECIIDIEAEVRLPAMVVAAKGPLARGRILQDTDLVWLSLPPASKISPDDCICDFDLLIGKQLRKSVSTQQPIRNQDVGEPFAVQAGESVTIAVVAGSIQVEAQGRAMESGAIDETIQVEVLPQKKRVAARIAAERRVEVIAGSGGTTAN
jgi:flagella basal body P-ring formation protein FlgA